MEHSDPGESEEVENAGFEQRPRYFVLLTLRFDMVSENGYGWRRGRHRRRNIGNRARALCSGKDIAATVIVLRLSQADVERNALFLKQGLRRRVLCKKLAIECELVRHSL